MLKENEYEKEKAQIYRDVGMYECCGIPNPIGEQCGFILCPITKEQKLLKEKRLKADITATIKAAISSNNLPQIHTELAMLLMRIDKGTDK